MPTLVLSPRYTDDSAWGAGVYGCDPAKVLGVLDGACVPRAGLTPEGSRWALEPAELER